MTILLDSLTSNPIGTENGLITRNIPSGTQDVSGSEIIADQGLSTSNLNNGWPVIVTDGYNILGTTNNPINTVLSLASRTAIVFAATNVSGVSLETMITLTPFSDFTPGTTGTSFAVTAGKILRLQCLTLAMVVIGSGIAKIRLKISNSGTVTTSTNTIIPITCDLGSNGFNYLTYSVTIPDGLELSNNMQLGISQLESPSSTFDISLIGYEYTA